MQELIEKQDSFIKTWVEEIQFKELLIGLIELNDAEKKFNILIARGDSNKISDLVKMQKILYNAFSGTIDLIVEPQRQYERKYSISSNSEYLTPINKYMMTLKSEEISLCNCNEIYNLFMEYINELIK